MDTVKARKAMVDSQVRPNDVPNVRLQRAMETVPREIFVPANRRSLAYVEKDIPLFEDRCLLKARDFSKLVQEADITRDDVVLDIACGYGYSAAIIGHLASVVVGLEESDEVVEKASGLVADLQLDNVAVVQGAIGEGYPKQAPFDVIIIAAGIEKGLEPLLNQLSPNGGRLVTIVMKDGVGHATLFTRNGEAIGDRILFEAYPSCILPAFRAEKVFSF